MTKTNWKVWTVTPAAKRLPPGIVSITPCGHISLGEDLVARLGTAKVALVHDPEHKRIALRPARPHDNGYVLGKGRGAVASRIGATVPLTRWGLLPETILHVTPRWEEGLLVIDLTGPDVERIAR